ncbi:Glycosyltransferase [Methanosarcina siciliae T4/M]|uniref:Glycosyltransferase n=1 Tax=Methanosarcina siciliae T4/M TaxID=1434120 RepID=A0A0E3P939_9EURY|nr:glycosyltransferase family 4 protein [Methanosarcina siciliae]AKB30500.1 Glycosyltransferase [Methanosarcina siciliae T4/M]
METKVVLLGQYPIDPENISGGVEACILGIVNEFKKYPDIDLHIVTVQILKKNVYKNIEGISVHYLASPPFPRFLTVNTIDRYKVINKIKEINPDLVHGHISNYGYYALKSGYPSIVTIHGIAKEEYNPQLRPSILDSIRRKVHLPMEEFCLKNARILTTVSPYVMEKIESFCKGDVYVIPNGIRDEFFKIQSQEVGDRLLFIGGIEPRKGLLNIIKAVEMICTKRDNIRLHIVGRIRKQGYYDSLVEYIKQNNLSSYVIFRGALDNEELKRELSECSIFVFPSKEESFGIVLAEAEACGKPIVTSNIGGIPYVVDNNRTGFLVEYGDVNSLADKILTLLENKNLRISMGIMGREKAREFSNKSIAEKYYSLYQKAIRNVRF